MLTLLLLLFFGCLVNCQQLLSNPRCNHWPDRGTCELEFQVKWYYDRYDHRCRRFFYGGCEGNENRFDTLEECSSQCHYQEPSNRDRCFQPHNPGTCNSDIERWFFDQEKKQCVCSWWSGCGGNSNIYYSYNHCMLICGDYAENGPGIDEKYWGRQMNRSMSLESLQVFNNPTGQFNRYSEEPYPVQVPVENYNYQGGYSSDNHLLTINISHSDDGPSYFHAAPVSSVPFGRALRTQTDGITIHRFDSEPRQLQEIGDQQNNWQIQEHNSFQTGKRRFQIQKKKIPPRMVHLSPRQSSSNAYRIQLDGAAAAEVSNRPVTYQVVREEDAHVQQHHQISQALQDEAEETQRRIQETMRRNYLEKRYQRPQTPTQLPHTPQQKIEHPDLVNQFRSHLDEHEKALRRKLEAQFPDHIITLIPHIETTRHADGRNIVRQRIQWTAHPKSSHYQLPPQNQFQQMIPQIPVTPQIPVAFPTRESFQPSETPTPTLSAHEIARLHHEEQQKKYEEDRKRHMEEHQRLMSERQKEREKIIAEREKAANERRLQYENEMKQRALDYKMRLTTTPTPTTTIETTTEQIPVTATPLPVREVVYDADVRRPPPTHKSIAEPVEHFRPIIENVTPAPLSLEDIIAMDNQRSDYDDEYDVPMDFPDTEAPPLTTRASPSPQPRTPVTSAPVSSPTHNAGGGLSPIVLPPGKKSRLFAPPSSEEYTQEVDFDPYVDFVM